MTYDLDSELDRKRFATRCEHLLQSRPKVELTKHIQRRTLSQNALLHVWIACIAQELGYTSREDCKRDVKRQILGMRPYENKITGKTYYTDYSVRREFKRSDFYARLANIVYRLLYNAETPRNGILVFTQFIEEAQRLKSTFQGIAEIVTGDTPRAEREEILARFKAGDIRVVANVNCLSVGFDYPELDTVVLARPTMSLRLYYQQVGRAIRPHKDKPEAWIVDLVGTTRRFGRVEDLNLRDTTGNGAWVVESGGRQLTGIAMN